MSHVTCQASNEPRDEQASQQREERGERREERGGISFSPLEARKQAKRHSCPLLSSPVLSLLLSPLPCSLLSWLLSQGATDHKTNPRDGERSGCCLACLREERGERRGERSGCCLACLREEKGERRGERSGCCLACLREERGERRGERSGCCLACLREERGERREVRGAVAWRARVLASLLPCSSLKEQPITRLIKKRVGQNGSCWSQDRTVESVNPLAPPSSCSSLLFPWLLLRLPPQAPPLARKPPPLAAQCACCLLPDACCLLPAVAQKQSTCCCSTSS
jgi:hypothetical protein